MCLGFLRVQDLFSKQFQGINGRVVTEQYIINQYLNYYCYRKLEKGKFTLGWGIKEAFMKNVF